jgi:hypothetical protein
MRTINKIVETLFQMSAQRGAETLSRKSGEKDSTAEVDRSDSWLALYHFDFADPPSLTSAVTQAKRG